MKLTLWEQDIKREAREEGKIKTLLDLICRKIAMKRPLEAIAEDLGTDLSEIKRIYDVAIKYAPDCDQDKILAELRDKYEKAL